MICYVLLNNYQLPFLIEGLSQTEYIDKIRNEPIDFSCINSVQGKFISPQLRGKSFEKTVL